MLNYKFNKIKHLYIEGKINSTYFKKQKINSMLKENYDSTKKSPIFPLSTHNFSTPSTQKSKLNMSTFYQHRL